MAAIITNLGAAESRGVEIAATARLSDNFSVNAGLSWLDATYGGGTKTGRVVQAGVCDGEVCAGTETSAASNSRARRIRNGT